MKRTPDRKKKETVQVTITITRNDLDTIDKAAEALAITRTSLIRNIVSASVNPQTQNLVVLALDKLSSLKKK